MSGRNISLVTQQMNDMFARMEPRHIALLVAKILHPDTPIVELTTQLWPDLGYARRKEILNDAKLTAVLKIIKEKPWIMSAIMAGKLAPVMVATLFELSQNADKDNVRATAAKELIRLAQSTAHQLVVGEDYLATEELDKELDDAEKREASQFLIEAEGTVDAEEEDLFSS